MLLALCVPFVTHVCRAAETAIPEPSAAAFRAVNQGAACHSRCSSWTLRPWPASPRRSPPTHTHTTSAALRTSPGDRWKELCKHCPMSLHHPSTPTTPSRLTHSDIRSECVSMYGFGCRFLDNQENWICRMEGKQITATEQSVSSCLCPIEI